MKVQLVVVQGKPEGKIIPLLGPVFKIGRGDTCHLRPNSELVSREHVEFTVGADTVVVKDLGSRNGTIVNGKALTSAYQLKDRDLIQVGNLTFAISIQGAPVVTAKAPTAEGAVQTTTGATAPAKKPSGSGVGNDAIESWLFGEGSTPKPDRSSDVYGGDTISVNTIKSPPPGARPPAAPAATPASVEGDDDIYERLPEGEGDPENEHDPSSDTEDGSMIPEEFLDESNPFFVKKKSEAESKPAYKDTSDAASDILKKMMERRRRPS